MEFRTSVTICLMLAVSVSYGFPQRSERRSNLNSISSSSILGALASTQSNGTAAGPGSFVEVSGVVSAESGSASDVLSTLTDSGTSSIASQVNCSEYSYSAASGGLSADAIASGDCLMNINDSGSHYYETNGKQGNNVVEGLSIQLPSRTPFQALG